MDHTQFIQANARELEKHHGYELAFASNVLARVRDLDFEHVSHQHPFRDQNGRDRRIDFAISEPSGVRLAIEVDGYDKTGTGIGLSPEAFSDFLMRQNALVSQGWLVLRFSNARVRSEPQACAAEIETSLRLLRDQHKARARQNLEALGELVQSLPPATAPKRDFGGAIATGAVILLLGAMLEMPGEYYTFLRLAISATALVGVLRALNAARLSWFWVFGAIMALYNPVWPVYLVSKSAWTLVNVITGALIVAGFRDLRASRKDPVAVNEPGHR